MSRHRLSDEQRRVLKLIRSGRATTPRDCRCSYLTFAALEKRGLISVETTFSSIYVPQKAHAWITDAGRAALPPSPNQSK